METSTIKTADLNNALITKFVGANLRNDDIYQPVSLIDVKSTYGFDTRRGIEKQVFCDGVLVNSVSKDYGLLSNEMLFGEVERKLAEAGIEYVKRSTNRNNCSFAVDYIFNDSRFIIKVKNGIDKILPMLRFVNSYDGSNKAKGSFGVYRQVCSNGLFAFRSSNSFGIKHSGKIEAIIPQKLQTLVDSFTTNEYYTLSRKFEVLAETVITDMDAFIKLTAEKLGLFKYEMSEKNPLPSLNARMVAEIMKKEASLLGTNPTLWNGYNAFNEVLHTKLKKSFEQQVNIDSLLFDAVLELA